MKFIFTTILVVLINFLWSQNTVYLSTEKAIEEIDYMHDLIEKIHYNPYFSISKDSFNLYKETIIRGFNKDSISYKKLVVSEMKLTALLSGGHTNTYWKSPNVIPELKKYLFIPFTGKLTYSNQQFIVSRSNDSEISAGVEIESINGIDILDLYRECMSYTGGLNSYRNASCEKMFPLYLFFNEELKAPYLIKFSDGSTDYKTKGLSVEEFLPFINNNLKRENYSFEVLEDTIGLISYNRCVDYKGFNRFLKKTFKLIKKQQIKRLIIDIRENGGGNSELNDLLLSYLTRHPYRQSSGRYWKVSEESKAFYQAESVYLKILGEDFMKKYIATENQSVIENLEEELIHPSHPKNFFEGKSCFLIGPNTFSSANFLADAIKTYKISTLIGMPTGENTNDFGELLKFTLPFSKNTVYVSSTYDIGANGNPDIFEPVFPDIEVENNTFKFSLNWIKSNVDN